MFDLASQFNFYNVWPSISAEDEIRDTILSKFLFDKILKRFCDCSRSLFFVNAMQHEYVDCFLVHKSNDISYLLS